jgi:hypothetical protein
MENQKPFEVLERRGMDDGSCDGVSAGSERLPHQRLYLTMEMDGAWWTPRNLLP